MKTFETVEPGNLYRLNGLGRINLARDCKMKNGIHQNWHKNGNFTDQGDIFLVLRKDKPCKATSSVSMVGRLYVVAARNGLVGYVHVYRGDTFEEVLCQA